MLFLLWNFLPGSVELMTATPLMKTDGSKQITTVKLALAFSPYVLVPLRMLLRQYVKNGRINRGGIY